VMSAFKRKEAPTRSESPQDEEKDRKVCSMHLFGAQGASSSVPMVLCPCPTHTFEGARLSSRPPHSILKRGRPKRCQGPRLTG
jgi:hypothetical protein